MYIGFFFPVAIATRLLVVCMYTTHRRFPRISQSIAASPPHVYFSQRGCNFFAGRRRLGIPPSQAAGKVVLLLQVPPLCDQAVFCFVSRSSECIRGGRHFDTPGATQRQTRDDD